VEPEAPPAPLVHLAELWQSRVEVSVRATLRAALVFGVMGLAHVARIGTSAARLGVAAVLLVGIAGYVVREILMRRGWQRPGFIVSRTIAVADPDLGARTLRALRLTERTAVDNTAGSDQLAREHLLRLIARASAIDVGVTASRAARIWYRAGLVAAAGAIVAVAVGPFRVIEGLDVLVARNGVAPIGFEWIDDTVVSAHQPEYLRQKDVTIQDPSEASFPNGTAITVRGLPVHAGRRLVLTDGKNEVPFVDDARGGVVARWVLGENASLNVAARFGQTLIRAPGAFAVTSIPDDRPEVELSGAPRTIRLIDEPRIDLGYEVADDHGIRQIDLVLRSGTREDRRVLATPNGEARHDRGAHVLRAADPFFRRAVAPVEVTIEARDDDRNAGPKWGKSEKITVIPPVLGEPEAMRSEAVLRSLDALVDLLAHRMAANLSDRKVHVSAEAGETDRAIDQIERDMSISYGGLRMPRQLVAAAGGIAKTLRKAMVDETRAATETTHAANRKAAEDAVLALNAVLRRLSATDAAAVAKRLAEVADEAAEGAAWAGHAADRQRGLARLEAAVGVIDSAGAQLRRLGALGDDLGEIVANDIKRVRRARSTEDFVHAELAARDLAARLRHPAPSFEGGRRSGVESGYGGSTEASDSDDESGQIAREKEQIDDLARDHAAEVWAVEHALGAASSKQDAAALADEAKAHAKAVREAVRWLPATGGEPGSAESAATNARDLARAMADDLEAGGLAEAVKSGRSAAAALEQAARAKPDPWAYGDAKGESRRAASMLAPEIQWAERALDQVRRAASARASADLRGAAPRESALADRARAIAREGRNAAGAVEDPTLDLLGAAEQAMRQASGALGSADGDRALGQQREAQRLLEMARSDGDADDGSGDPSNGDEGKRSAREADGRGDFDRRGNVPRADDFKGPDAFRRRVVEGLGGSADPRLRDAVKRYAEGLLK
jgi:hypothetical protein